MASRTSFNSLTRFAAVALLAGTTLCAGGPWFRGGGSGRVGFSGRTGYSAGVWVHGGPSLRVLPRSYVAYHYHGSPYYFGGGYWYRPWGGGYAACYPPLGLGLAVLPLGFATYWYGGVPYYYYENVYYTDSGTGGYVVAQPPPGREDQPRTAAPEPPKAVGVPDPVALEPLLIVPKEGQGEALMTADRDGAKRYAIGKSGYDPAHSDPSDPGTARARQAYLKAMRAYLEQRGYSVK